MQRQNKILFGLVLILMICLVSFTTFVQGVHESSELGTETKIGSLKLTSEEQTWLDNHPIIRVHNELDWPPFDFNRDGIPQGYSVEYMDLLADKLDLEIEYISGPSWNEFLDMIQNKDLDVMINIVNTEDRRKYIEFTEPYLHTLTGIYIKDGEQAFNSLLELEGKTISLPEGFFEQELLERYYPNINLYLVRNNLEAIEAVLNGDSDVAIGELAVMDYIFDDNLITGISLSGTIKDERFDNVLNLGVRNDWPVLRDILQKAMDAVSYKEHQKLLRKWVVKEKGTIEFTDEEIAWLSEHKNIRLGFDPSWAPFEYADELGEYTGLSSEYIWMMEDILGVEIVPQKGLSWAQVLSEAKEKNLDIISSVAITPERSDYLIFTEPYFSSPIVLVGKEDQPLVTDMSGLKGNKIAVVESYFTHEYMIDNYPDFELVLVDSIEEGLKQVESGNALGILDNLISINYATKKLALEGYQVVFVASFSYEIRIGIRDDWFELVGILNKIIASVPEVDRRIMENRWTAIHVKKLIPWDTIWAVGLIITSVSAVIIGIIFFWNRKLVGEIKLRTKIESDLRDSEDRFKNIFNNVYDIILVHDLEGNILDINDVAVKIFGFSKKQLLKNGVLGISAEKNRDKAEKQIASKIALVRSIGPQRFEWKFKKENGKTFWSEVSLKQSKLHNEFRILAVVRDITEKKNATARLQKNLRDAEVYTRKIVGRELRMVELKNKIKELEAHSYQNSIRQNMLDEGRSK